MGAGGRGWACITAEIFSGCPCAPRNDARVRAWVARAPGNLRSSARGPVATQFCTGQAEGAKQIDTGQVRTVAGRGRVLAGIVTGAI